jgi:predicted Zn finger-like uncharacterized protein
MLIVCQSCASEYMIDPARLGAEGRTVRCAGCKETWFVAPEAEGLASAAAAVHSVVDDDVPDDWGDPSADEAALDEAATEREVWMQAQPGGRETAPGIASRLVSFAGPLAILTVVMTLGAAVWGRAEVVRLVPATAALYAGIGLPVNLRGLEFRAVRSELVGVGAETFLVVEGEIANISGRDASVPPIEIGLRGAEGQMLYTWSNDPPQQTVTGHNAVSFRARLAAPPAAARQVLVRFAPARDGAAFAGYPR